MIKLTIAVPAYNAQDTIRKCLDSMADERFSGRLEVIVVNDGSADSTAEIAGEYAARFPAIFRLISKENGGHGSGVNTGIENARGKYFRIVDSDDWVATEGLAALLDAMEIADPDCFIDERTEIYMDEGVSKHVALPENAHDGEILSFETVFGDEYACGISMHTMTVRTDLLRSHGIRLLEHTYYVDMQYVIGIAAYAKTAYLLRRNVYCYRLGSAQQSVNYRNYAKNYSQHDRVLKACAKFCSERREEMPRQREAHMRRMLVLLARTQFNIALIYNPNRREGRRQMRELEAYLRQNYPWLLRATRSRRISARILHGFGVGYPQLQRLKSLRGKLKGKKGNQ